MSTETAKLIASYETLPEAEKQEFVKALVDRLLRFNSGPLDDEEVALAGDQLAAMLDEEESAPRLSQLPDQTTRRHHIFGDKVLPNLILETRETESA